MKPVIVVGAGFSGLTLAYELHRLGLPVTVVEQAERAGGLIATERSDHGLIETAANALLADKQVEKLFADLKIQYAAEIPARKRRYIFWKKPRRWPVSWLTTLKLIKLAVIKFFSLESVRPHRGESVSAWARRKVNAQFEQRLLAPALQGVYAGDPARMSARLILTNLFEKPPRGKKRGSVAPLLGMGELVRKLAEHLRESGVQFEYATSFTLPEKLEQPTVLCTSAWAAAEIVQPRDAALAGQLRACESLPIVSVTAFFEPHKKDLKGFGCLFPEGQGFQALGVLFNSSIFAGRSNRRSETWIYGGAGNLKIAELTDSQIESTLAADRLKLTARKQAPLAVKITRRPRALPHYTIDWEQSLRGLKVNRPLFLHGNYLGPLGLAKIFSRSKALATQIKDLYVS